MHRVIKHAVGWRDATRRRDSLPALDGISEWPLQFSRDSFDAHHQEFRNGKLAISSSSNEISFISIDSLHSESYARSGAFRLILEAWFLFSNEIHTHVPASRGTR